MNRQHTIIDGYNLLHAIPALKKTLAHDAASARESLIHAVAQLTHRRKIRCTIVFDGAPPGTSGGHPSHAPVHVVYSHPVSADEKIRSMIEHSKNRSLLSIVSSDRGITDFARVCSCETHASKHFANLLTANDDAVTEKTDAPLSPSQIQEWLTLFEKKQPDT